MILLKSLLTEEQTKKISLQQAMDNKLFGPVFHGTTSDKREKIGQEGFKVFYGTERSGDVSHGYEVGDYYGGIPAPVHHLGFGIYFTTSLTIAKQYSYGTTKGMRTYFLDAPSMEIINFGAPRTMMKWWRENGYDFKPFYDPNDKNTMFSRENLKELNAERYRATVHMTEELKSKYDAVWFKGKGLRRLLDGDQVCIFDPSNIYEMDKSLIKPGEIGSRVVAKVGIDPYGRGEIVIPIGTKGIIIGRQKPNEFQKWAEGSDWIYQVKFDKGGRQHNILDKWIEPYQKK